MHKEQEKMYTRKDGTVYVNQHENCYHDYKEIDIHLKHKQCSTCGKLEIICNHDWSYHDGVTGCRLCGQILRERY